MALMDSRKNKISFDFANNPELKALFSGWQIGKSYKLEVAFQLDEMTEQGASCTLQEITSEEPEAEPMKMDADHPVMAVMSAGADGTKQPYGTP